MRAKLERWARGLKTELVALWICRRDPRTPWAAKLLAALVVAYAFSPIDLIPDFIPVLGYLDDLLLVPLGIYLTLKLIPPPVLDEARREAAAWLDAQHGKPKSYWVAAAVIVVWLAVAAWAWTVVREWL